ncbi:flagellar hook-associated protein FlgK [Glutamicibacter sp. MCAF14]|uniref:flagellar hook-associated protein FlgK n=1 Tax=Glutamicibacter sp. MCAF14 TaxID=3233043 RepID=UPI003F8FDB5D
MSTFGNLYTALSGLNAARAGMEIAGNNLANVATPGYTRQRAELSAAEPLASTGRLAAPTRVGQGVVLSGIARLADASLDARVRGTVALAAQGDIVAQSMSDLEGTLREPGEDGLSALLNNFWAGWDDVANQPGEAGAATVLIQTARTVADRIGQMNSEIEVQWAARRQNIGTWVADVNSSATTLAALNGEIRSALASGSVPNALLDQRSQLAQRIAQHTGATVREHPDGSLDVLIDGNPLVTGTTARSLELSGGEAMDGAPLVVSWNHRPGSMVTFESGSIAGGIAVLSTVSGPLAAAAASLDAVASALAASVNEVHAAGQTVNGEAGSDFFEFDTQHPAASLRVLVASADELASASPGNGALDGSNAQQLADLASKAGGPDKLWSTMVLHIANSTHSEADQALSSAIAADAALSARHAASAVSLDEENVALISNQHAFQGAARVLTAVDEMLDTLINRTGLVGR